MTGVEMIETERRRQLEEEGYTPAHDAEYIESELSQAAACYAQDATDRMIGAHGDQPPAFWPFAPEDWKPGDSPLEELVKAGALIAAEIDRIIRSMTPVAEPPME